VALSRVPSRGGVVGPERRGPIDPGPRRSRFLYLGKAGRTFIAADKSRHPSRLRDLIFGPAAMTVSSLSLCVGVAFRALLLVGGRAA
jgi:hypothetical protein